MANKPAENLIYEFLGEHTAELFPTEDFELRPTPYDTRKKNNGIEIGDADTSLLPNGNQDNMTEFDALLTIEIFARVTDKEKMDRVTARQTVFDLKLKMLQLFEEYPSLGNRGCRVLVLRQVRFYEDIRSDKWAIERVPIVLNPKELKGE